MVDLVWQYYKSEVCVSRFRVLPQSARTKPIPGNWYPLNSQDMSRRMLLCYGIIHLTSVMNNDLCLIVGPTNVKPQAGRRNDLIILSLIGVVCYELVSDLGGLADCSKVSVSQLAKYLFKNHSGPV